jgi:anti-anti-sigma factor
MLKRQPYAFSLSRIHQYCVVHAAGELDIAAVAQLRDAVHAARRRAGHVVIDLREVSFLDSFALHELTALQGGESGRPRFHVVPSNGIQRVLDLTGARAALCCISPEQLGD